MSLIETLDDTTKKIKWRRTGMREENTHEISRGWAPKNGHGYDHSPACFLVLILLKWERVQLDRKESYAEPTTLKGKVIKHSRQ